jgi:hypothetical protein
MNEPFRLGSSETIGTYKPHHQIDTRSAGPNEEAAMNNRRSMSRIAAIVGFIVMGAIFFFGIIGVFGLRGAVLGLVVFIVGAVVSFRLDPAERMEP